MGNYYMIDGCMKCNKKACVVVYDVATDHVLDADVFVWICPACNHENQLPIAKVANSVTWDKVKGK